MTIHMFPRDPFLPMKKSKKELTEISKALKVLTDTNRLSIIQELMYGSQTVGHIHESLQMEQSLVSHHLSVLKKWGYVFAEKKGREVFYKNSGSIKKGFSKLNFNFGCCSIRLKE